MANTPRLLVFGGARGGYRSLGLYGLPHGTGSTCPTHVAVVRLK